MKKRRTSNMVQYVRQLAPAEKLELYKQIKGWSLFEGSWNVNAFKNVLDEKVKDVRDVLLYDVYIDCNYWYQHYVNGRY